VAESSTRFGRLAGCGRALCLSIALLAIGAAAASADPYAPLDQPGPPLSVPRSALQASLYCEPGVRNAKVEPVLLNPATGVNPEENFAWNYEPALDTLGIPWCAYTAPFDTLGNIETSGEYLVHAIRTEYALARRKIAIIGHSQGGMSMRWALRFWPDTRTMVDKVIGFDGSNHGTTSQPPGCADTGCPPADWQQGADSAFIHALNSGAETFSGISYTEIYTYHDEVVLPNSGDTSSTCSSCLFTGAGQIRNVAVQTICPNDPYEHILVIADPVAYALALDALTHAGPADPARIPHSVCSQLFMPGVTEAQVTAALQPVLGLPTLLSVALGPLAPATSGVTNVTAEPALACYAFATCTGAQAPTLRVAYRLPRGRPSVARVHVSVLEGYQLEPVPGATVRLAGHTKQTNANGNVTVPVTALSKGRYRVTASRPGCNSVTKTLVL
jgi:pimeloyl-ACP methyl ester carboxylesterase